MKKMAMLLSFLMAMVLVLAGTIALAWQETEISKLVEFPRKINIVPPDANLPLTIASLSGRWEARWDSGAPCILIIEKIADNKLEGFYCWGRDKNGKSDYAKFNSKISGSQLEPQFEYYSVKSWGWVKINFVLTESKKLEGKYENNFGAKAKIVMEKIE